MNTITKKEKLEKIGQEVRQLVRNTGESIIKLGIYLNEVKSICEYGEWQEWLKQYFNYSIRTAQRFMNIANKFKDLPNPELYQPTALYLLASESISQDIVKEVIELSSQGEIITPKLIKEIEATKNEQKEHNDIIINTEISAELYLDTIHLTEIENDTMTNFNNLMNYQENNTMTDLDYGKNDTIEIDSPTTLNQKDDTMTDLSNTNSDNTHNVHKQIKIPENLSETRHLAAIGRTELSTPIRLAIERGYINKDRTHFDYGCGRAGDIIRLRMQGIESYGWDPFFFPKNPIIKSDIVTLIYVLNGIECYKERIKILLNAYSLANIALIIALRTDSPPSNILPYNDGHITNLKTFQKHYSQKEAIEFIESCLKSEIISLSSGIFAVEIYDK